MGNIDEIKEILLDLDNKINEIIVNSVREKTTYAQRLINQFYFNKYLEDYNYYKIELKSRLLTDIYNKKVLKK